MKYELLIRFLLKLLSRKNISATEFASEFEISKRTVFRYIECLELAGIPIYSTRGRYGGFSIVDTFRLPTNFLTEQEHHDTLNALNAIVEQLPNKNIESVITKLSLSKKNSTNNFDIKGGNLIIDAGSWGEGVDYKIKLQVIEKAIQTNNLLSIVYHDRNGQITMRQVEPHLIVFKQGLWYVYAFCKLREEFRLFKTGRIESATILSENFKRREINKNELPFSTWYNSDDLIDITFTLKKEILSDVEEWLGIKNVEIQKNEYVAHAKMPHDKETVSKLLSFGKNITITKPQTIVSSVKQMAKDILQNYNKN